MTLSALSAPLFLCAYGSVALAFLMPGHYAPWASFEQQTMAALGLGLFTLGMLRLDGVPAWRPGVLGWTALALAVVALVQHGAQHVAFISDAVLPALYLLGLALAITSARALSTGARNAHWTALCAALGLAATISTAMAWCQWLQVDVLPWTTALRPRDRPGANLAQPNHLATLLMLGLVATAQLYQRRLLGAVVGTLLATFLLTGVVITQSRTAWLGCALVAVWLVWQRHLFQRRLSPTLVTVLLLLVALAAYGFEAISDSLLLPATTLENRLTAGPRLINWATLVDAALRQPWVGYGFNQVPQAQLGVALGHPVSQEQLSNSHNLVLDLALWCGIPIAAAVLALSLWWFVQRVRQCQSGEQVLLLAAFMAVVVHAMLEYPLDYFYFLLPWGMVIGHLDNRSAELNASKAVDSTAKGLGLPHWLYVLLLVLGGSTTVLVAYEYLHVQAAAFRARMHLAGLQGPVPVDFAPPKVHLLDASREFHRTALEPARAGMSPEEMHRLRQVTLRFPNPPMLLRHALALGLNGKPAEAVHSLALLCHVHETARCQEAQASWQRLRSAHPELPELPVTGNP